MTTVPRWDLAPKLDRPLSLWKPQDYALIIYWVFFFPQALKWYERTYCPAVPGWAELPFWQRGRKFLTTPQGKFWLQAQLAHIVATPTLGFGLAFLFQLLGFEVDWGKVAFGLAGGGAFGLVVGGAFGLARGLTEGLAEGVAVGVTVGVAFGVAGGVVGGVVGGVAGGVAVGVAGAVVVGIMFGVERGGGEEFGEGAGVVFGVVFGMVGSITGGVEDQGLVRGMVTGLSFTLIYLMNSYNQFGYYFAEMDTVLLLSTQLESDVSNGLHNSQELLRYTYQLTSVQEAINLWLAKVAPEQLLPLLCEIMEQLALHTEEWFFWSKWRSRRILLNWHGPTTSVGQVWQNLFWLFEGSTGKLRKVLETNPKLKALPHGQALYQRVKALDEISEPDNIQEISHWYVQQKWLEKEGDETFRPHFLATLRQLRHIAGDVHIAQHSLSKLRKTAALGRASGDLQSLEQNLPTICSPLEQKAVLGVIQNWQKVVTQAAGQAGQLEITKPVENPFVVGAPVSGALFVGREDIFHQLEEMWGDDPGRVVDSVVLYGQRRMGKTSILQNIGAQFGAKTVVAFVNLQRLGHLEKEGELWSELAFTIYEALQKEGLANFDEPNLEQFLAHPIHEMNRFIAKVRPVLSGRRLILALDEFEELEKKMQAGEISEGVIDYVRGLIHSEPWLVVVLAGLHTLNEMTHNYWNPLFASVRPIRVSFLSEGMVGQLLANPHEDFPLDISREAAGFVHQWTAGQPLLVQLTGSRLVRLYNQILFEQGVKRSEQFTVEDVQAVMFEPEFFIQGSGYFQGVWGQTEPGLQQQLLQVLAQLTHFERPQVAEEVLWERLGCTPEMGQEALAALQQRDIVRCTNGLVGFTVPLLRYWVGEVRRG